MAAMNQIRAMRINEIIQDFRSTQGYIAAIRYNPSAEEYNEEGYQLLRDCVRGAQALLSRPFQTQSVSGANDEQAMVQLQRIIIDASVRRFQTQKYYLRALAALRWANGRTAVLQGQRPHAGHAPALYALRESLRMELASITDAYVELSLRQADSAAGKWLEEDPSLAMIQRAIGTGR